jgi:hypothetical protein
MPGDKQLGAACYEFDGAEFRAEIATVPGLAEHWIDSMIEEVYPLHLDSRPAVG